MSSSIRPAWPFLRSIYLSFTRYNIVTEPKWVGGANYRMLLTQDELFWKSAWVTVNYAMISVPLGIVFGVALALLLNANVRGMAGPWFRATRDTLSRQGFSVQLTEIPDHNHWYYDIAPRINAGAWEFFKRHEIGQPRYQQYRFAK